MNLVKLLEKMGSNADINMKGKSLKMINKANISSALKEALVAKNKDALFKSLNLNNEYRITLGSPEIV